MQCNGAQQFEKICRAQAQQLRLVQKKVEICKKVSTNEVVFLIIRGFPFPDGKS
jgi:hypothetical protein